MTSARNFSRPVKRAAYKRANGRCENPSCGIALPAGFGGINYDHIIAWTISHDSSLDNCRLLCVPCHGGKTSAHDRPVIDKNRRLRDAAIGIKRAGKKLPGGRDSGISITFRGPVRRQSQAEKHRAVMAKRQIGISNCRKDCRKGRGRSPIGLVKHIGCGRSTIFTITRLLLAATNASPAPSPPSPTW